jgi:hypothetical protein
VRLSSLLVPLLLLSAIAAAPAQAARRYQGQDEFLIVATWSYPSKLQLQFVDWTLVPQPWAALNGKLRAWCYRAGEQFEFGGTATLKPKQKQAVFSLKKEAIPNTPWLAPVAGPYAGITDDAICAFYSNFDVAGTVYLFGMMAL